MKLIIPAAGVGIRLAGSMDNPFPKLLIPLQGRPLISHLLRIASCVGPFSDVVLILGPEYERVTETVRDLATGVKWTSKTTITCIRNPKYSETNSIYSVWLAREFLQGDVVLHDGDVLITPSAFKRLVSSASGNDASTLIDTSTPVPMEETKIRMSQDRIIAFNESIASDAAKGRYVGVTRFTPTTSTLLKQQINSLVQQGDVKVYYTKAIDRLTADINLKPVWTDEASWLEIDTLEDLRAAGNRARQIIDEIRSENQGTPANFVVRVDS